MPLVAEIVLTQPAPSVTLLVPIVPGRHLRIRARGASDAPVDHVSVGLQINGDTAQNYSWVWNEVIGGPPSNSPASGGDDEFRARVGLVPGAALQVPYAAGDVDISIPHYLDTTFLRGFTFTGGETLGITRDIFVAGHGIYWANRVLTPGGGTQIVSNIGYATSPAGMQNGILDPINGLWWDSGKPYPPNALRTTGGGVGSLGSLGSLSTPSVVNGITILLDVGNWVPGSRVQLYVED